MFFDSLLAPSGTSVETVKRMHKMPFGAAPLEDGQVRFRLWAPAARRVDLCLSRGNADSSRESSAGESTLLAMDAEPEGWFGITTGMAAIGSRYRFRIDGEMRVPDPASRFQPDDVHGPSEVIDPGAWAWHDASWSGRAWEETIIYELHVGSFTAHGTFAAVQDKLDYLAELGITAIELMPVADFPGKRNWGYDGTYLFAPDSRYGRPEALKALVDAAHARGLMVFLDVVYNHFGPEGNYLHVYAPQFFTQRHTTPWGAAINYDGTQRDWVRQFFVDNALYWLEEFHLDGLRLDAVHAIMDDSRPDILTTLAQHVHDHFGRSRHIHLILENDHNAAHYLARDALARPRWYVAQWNDDIHHALHVLLTGESGGYYRDYADDPIRHLGRCLAEGFAYQGEPSVYRNDQARGEPSGHLPPTAFVSFLQNHDQVGNRAFGERITLLAQPQRVRAALALLLLAPSPPLLFMGQEWGCAQPFAFFCDFGPDLADKVAAGRREEFARFAQFRDPESRQGIPDPSDRTTFERSVLDWPASNLDEHKRWLELHRELLALRCRELTPRLGTISARHQGCTRLSEAALSARWLLNDGSELLLLANFGDEAVTRIDLNPDQVLYATHGEESVRLDADALPPWSVVWCLRSQGTPT